MGIFEKFGRLWTGKDLDSSGNFIRENKLPRGRADGVFLPDEVVSKGFSSPQQATGYSAPGNKSKELVEEAEAEVTPGFSEMVAEIAVRKPVSQESSSARRRALQILPMPEPSSEYLTKSPEEEILAGGEPVSVHELEGGTVNKTIIVEIVNDGSGLFKPMSGEKEIRNNIPPGDYYKRERAAFLVSEMLGFGFVPPTVIREVEGETGSVQQFIADAEPLHMAVGGEAEWTKKSLCVCGLLI